MKKILLILGMVTCLASLSACGQAATTAEASVDSAAVEQVADYYMSVVDSLSGSGENIADYADQIQQYYGIEASVIVAAVENYQIALEDLGSYVSTQNVEFSEDGNVLTINSTIVGSNLDPDGNPRTAEVVMELALPGGEVKSILTNVNYTFKELMTNAALNTVLGMGTVFVVLIILMAIISLFKIINNMQSGAGRKASQSAATDSVDKAVAQIEKNEQAQDDTELIAVIAAAIAASEGAASADGYVVRSIRRRY
ncbi:MAG: OadG family protein [Lachnospiraceae bacterium]|nr:OadG family protein [Lachnospiraceae bacterium]